MAYEHEAGPLAHGKRSPAAKTEKKAAAASPKEVAEEGKKKISEVHIKPADGGFIVKHLHKPPHQAEEHNKEHVVHAEKPGDLEALHEHLDEHLGPEAMAEPEQEVAPAPGAAPVVANA